MADIQLSKITSVGLNELFERYQKQTPGSAVWYWTVDQIVSTLVMHTMAQLIESEKAEAEAKAFTEMQRIQGEEFMQSDAAKKGYTTDNT